MRDKNGKVIYTEMPPDIEEEYDRSVVIESPFLPPARLIRKVERERITISMPKRTLDFFRRTAQENGVKYQTLINELLSDYVDRHERHTLEDH